MPILINKEPSSCELVPQVDLGLVAATGFEPVTQGL